MNPDLLLLELMEGSECAEEGVNVMLMHASESETIGVQLTSWFVEGSMLEVSLIWLMSIMYRLELFVVVSQPSVTSMRCFSQW